MAILANVCLVRNHKRPLLELLLMQYEELVIRQVWGTRIRMVRNANYVYFLFCICLVVHSSESVFVEHMPYL